MKTHLCLTLFSLLLLLVSCEKSTVEPEAPISQANAFAGQILGQPTSYKAGENNFENRTRSWSSGSQSYAELGLGTTDPQTTQTELVINSKSIDGQLTADKFKALFAVGPKSAEGNYLGFHVLFRVPGNLYSSVGGEQPNNFLEVTQLEQLAHDEVNNKFKFKVTLKINCNLYQYANPNQFVGKIENGQMVCYFERN